MTRIAVVLLLAGIVLSQSKYIYTILYMSILLDFVMNVSILLDFVMNVSILLDTCVDTSHCIDLLKQFSANDRDSLLHTNVQVICFLLFNRTSIKTLWKTTD